MVHLERTMARMAATSHRHDNLIPSWRLAEKRKEREHRANIVSNTVLASGLREQRDEQQVEA
jgi:hypothetical protein